MDHAKGAVTLHLESWALCPIAQRVLIAAALRGQRVTRRISSGGEPQSTVIEPTILTVQGLGPDGDPESPVRAVQVTDGLAMVELVEDLYPDHPLHPPAPGLRAIHRNLMAIGAEAQTRLSRAARDAWQSLSGPGIGLRGAG